MSSVLCLLHCTLLLFMLSVKEVLSLMGIEGHADVRQDPVEVQLQLYVSTVLFVFESLLDRISVSCFCECCTVSCLPGFCFCRGWTGPMAVVYTTCSGLQGSMPKQATSTMRANFPQGKSFWYWMQVSLQITLPCTFVQYHSGNCRFWGNPPWHYTNSTLAVIVPTQ